MDGEHGDARGGGARNVDSRPTLSELSLRLTEAHASGAPPQFVAADPMDWIKAIDKLLARGRLEVARSALASLREQQPQLQWADSVLNLVDLLPEAVEAAPRFRDDLASDLQVVERPGSDTVVFAFCGRKQTIGMPLWLFQRWLSRLRASVVYLRDFDDTHYLGGIRSIGSEARTAQELERIAGRLGASRIVCLGNSSGGYAAALYGLQIGAEKVASFSGATNLEPEFNLHLNRVEAAVPLKQRFPKTRLDLRERYLAARSVPCTRLIYGEQAWDDRIHAEHMAGLPGVELMPIEGHQGHGTVAEMVRRRLFEAVLDDLATPSGSTSNPIEVSDPERPRRPSPGVSAAPTLAAERQVQASPTDDDLAHRFEPIPDSALEGSVLDRFELIADRFPDRLAVQDDACALTYAELRAQVARIAAAVAAAAHGREGPVALLARHDAGFPAAFLGVMAAGRTAVLLDSGHPVDRNRRIAAHSGACAVAAAHDLGAQARDIFPAGTPVIDLDAPAPASPAPWRRPGPDHIAYVLYTSGSTGQPKGVFHDHRTAVNDILLWTEFAQPRPADRLVIFYSGVIAATRRTLGALLNGASLHVLSASRLGAEGLAREIQARRITILVDVPTIFRRLVGALPEGERLESLRLVCLAGDRCDWSDYDAFTRVAGEGAVFAIACGSTEVSGTYARWFVDPAQREAGERLPIGHVVRAVSLWIEDAEGAPVPDGEIGEMVVSGRHLARGYWREPEMTAAKFQPDPLDPLARRFRTSDLGLRRPDGLFELVGRKDQQIKLRGHRIEPAEVEAALRSFAGVADAAAVVRRDAEGANRALVAYVELEPGFQSLKPRHLMAKLAHILPRHLTPSLIFVVRALPRLMNFKVDHTALQHADARRSERDGGRAADPILDRVARVFEAIVPGARATPEDNLLSLGGDSLQAVELALELGRAFGVEVPGSVLKQSQSIRALASWVARQSGAMDAAPA